ncbi:MAG: twin-arginine translocation signal domain-containing protein [Gammaproteobacteria bacterium]
MSHDDPLISKTEQRVPEPDTESRESLADDDRPLPGRRRFLRTGLAAGAASAIGMPASLADGPGSLPPEVPSWWLRGPRSRFSGT